MGELGEAAIWYQWVQDAPARINIPGALVSKTLENGNATNYNSTTSLSTSL
ncbi:hypothetical protein FOQG_10132 [Fusarium oxysporum f. sp. raphani 54005]|uniref:Uncharacterized protein n=2 Tax=Fusarium oxysporum TaxID=5507 RepID=X0C4G6_FUSOX|nr:hypothetical protein FOVG_10011 [Fusarium oxysporum f. sp. pisi HDV247]EXK86083.1 hypothetical protein FOQG_10132 [Fusarium oxysporum f. sp. raphani 54005]